MEMKYIVFVFIKGYPLFLKLNDFNVVFVLNYRFRPLSIQMMPLSDFSKKGKWATVSDKLRKYDTCNFMKIRRLVFVLIFLPKYY